MIVLADWLYRVTYFPPAWWMATWLIYRTVARRIA